MSKFYYLVRVTRSHVPIRKGIAQITEISQPKIAYKREKETAFPGQDNVQNHKSYKKCYLLEKGLKYKKWTTYILL